MNYKSSGFSLAIDWLQLHCRVKKKELLQHNGKSKTGKYDLQIQEIKNPIWSKHLNVKLGDDILAHLSFEPHSNILPETSSHLKINNKFLYSEILPELVADLLEELELGFLSVSRLDIAADFVKFKKMSCPAFIKSVVQKKLLKRYTTSFALQGMLTRSMPIHYIRFGSKNHEVQWYLYNKSKELREKTKKPWIEAHWQANGLPCRSRDIWRLEFSLKPSQFGVVFDGAVEIEFNNLDILKPSHLLAVFSALYQKHCDFRRNDGQVRKERMKKVELLNVEDYSGVFAKVSDKKESNRIHKVFIKMLHQLNNDWRIANQETNRDGYRMLHEYVEKFNLVEWYNKTVSELESKIKKEQL